MLIITFIILQVCDKENIVIYPTLILQTNIYGILN